jgi:hypothetical protein
MSLVSHSRNAMCASSSFSGIENTACPVVIEPDKRRKFRAAGQLQHPVILQNGMGSHADDIRVVRAPLRNVSHGLRP